jgi:hypothetical protein
MSLRDQLQAIYSEYGRLSPANVVEAARPSDHPLHDRFEWDDAIAGEAFRRDQAHQLIRSVRISRERDDDKPDINVRFYHAVQDPEGYAYRPTDEVLADPLTTQMVLRDMRREWMALKARYEAFEEFRALVLSEMAAAS